jgi:hypothetical protein
LVLLHVLGGELVRRPHKASGGEVTLTPLAGSAYYLVVPLGPAREGSCGTDAADRLSQSVRHWRGTGLKIVARYGAFILDRVRRALRTDGGGDCSA